MGERSGIARLGVSVATGVLVLAACGGSDGGGGAPVGTSGEAGVVQDTAAEVESAVVESTTPETAPAPVTTPETDPTVATVPPTEPATTPVVTEPAVTQPPVTQPPVTEPVATEPVSTGVPVGYRPIFDDSGELRANVPAEWVQTDGAPDGDIRQLAAAPDLPAFLASYTLEGMLLVSASSATPDAWEQGLATTLASSEVDGCTVSETSDYDDGVYTGTEHVLACGSDATVAHLIGGRDEDGELFFLLAIIRPVDDVDVRDQIVQSFFIN